MPPVRIRALRWDLAPVTYITRRATITEIEEVFANGPTIYASNRADRRSTHKAVGRTDAGRRLTIPFIYLSETNEAVPITCWQQT